MNNYSEQKREKRKNPNPTQEIKIEGVGSVKVYGEWNIEKIIKTLLEYDSITGG